MECGRFWGSPWHFARVDAAGTDGGRVIGPGSTRATAHRRLESPASGDTQHWSDTLSVGGNYTYIHRNLKAPELPIFRPTGLPNTKLFAYVDWQISHLFALTPSIESASNRWTVNTAGTRYDQTGSYTLDNIHATLSFTVRLELLLGVRKLFDDDYPLVDGFPGEGRNCYATLRVRL